LLLKISFLLSVWTMAVYRVPTNDNILPVKQSWQSMMLAQLSCLCQLRVWPVGKIEETFDLSLPWPDTKTKATLATFSFAWSPDGTRIAAGIENGSLCLWDIRTKSATTLGRATPDGDSVGHIHWSPDGRWIAAKYSSMLLVWDVVAAQCVYLKYFRSPESTPMSVAWSPDSEWLVFSEPDDFYAIWLWNVVSRQSAGPIAEITAQNVTALTWSATGHLIAGTQCGHISLWIRTGDFMSFQKQWRINEEEVISVACTGDYIVSSSDALRLWSISGELLREFRVRGASLVAASPDGNHVLSSGYTGTVLITVCKYNDRNHQAFPPATRAIVLALMCVIDLPLELQLLLHTAVVRGLSE
jgi:WD40 repeat protein